MNHKATIVVVAACSGELEQRQFSKAHLSSSNDSIR